MIRRCSNTETETIYQIINDASAAYKGVIPEDCWHEPYMSKGELEHEIGKGVRFWGFEESGELIGVMGIQDVQDVTLIRHAYIRTRNRNKGVGAKLLRHLQTQGVDQAVTQHCSTITLGRSFEVHARPKRKLASGIAVLGRIR